MSNLYFPTCARINCGKNCLPRSKSSSCPSSIIFARESFPNFKKGKSWQKKMIGWTRKNRFISKFWQRKKNTCTYICFCLLCKWCENKRMNWIESNWTKGFIRFSLCRNSHLRSSISIGDDGNLRDIFRYRDQTRGYALIVSRFIDYNQDLTVLESYFFSILES